VHTTRDAAYRVTAAASPAADRSSPAQAPAEAFGLRACARGVPRSVWTVTALFASLLLAYAVLLPVYRAPDEPEHVQSVLELERGRGWPAPGTDLLDPSVVASLRVSGLSPSANVLDRGPLPYRAGTAPARGDRGSFDTLSQPGGPPQVNQLTQHPPLYYALEAAALKLTGGTAWAYDQAVLFLRLVSALMVLPLPLLAFATARRLRGPGPVAVAASVLPLAVPQLLHIGASVNNDDLLIPLVGALTVALAFVMTGDLSRRTACWVGALSALALLTKGFAFMLPVWIGLTYTVALLRYRRRVAVGSGALALAVTTVLGGGWWLRNLLLYGALQPGGELIAPAPPGFVPDLSTLLAEYADHLPERFWGSFGWFDVALPDLATGMATAVLAVAILLALVGPRRLAIDHALVLLAPFVGLVLLVMLLTQRTYLASGQFRGLQGRYFLPAVVGVAVLVAVGLSGLLPRSARWLPLGCGVLVGVMQLVAVRTILDGFWRPVESGASYVGALHALFAWSAWPEPLATAALLAPLMLGLLVLGLLARSARSDRCSALAGQAAPHPG